MALSLKTRGLEELRSLRNRVVRQHMYGRISRPRRDWLVERLDEVEAYIIKMEEDETKKEEETDG